MARIVTYAHRYKWPPKRKKAVALKVGRIARAGDHPAEPSPDDAGKTRIVTAKRKPGRFGEADDLIDEEHQRRGDAADELFRELVRRATWKA